MLCNSCMTQINKNDVLFCTQCNVPLHNSCANHCLVCEKTLCDSCFGINNYKCETCKPPVVGFETIRRSHLELYLACPYSVYLQLVKGITPPSGDHAELGIMLHQIVDKMSNNLISLGDAKKEFKIWIDETFSNNEKFDQFCTTGMKTLETFNMIKPSFVNSINIETEKNIIFSLADGLPKVSCTLDRIDFMENGDIHIADWKTGKPMSGQKLITDLQPPLYIEAVHQEYGIYPKTFTLYYLAQDKIKVYEMTGTTTSKEGISYPIYTVKSGHTEYSLDVKSAIDRTKDILNKINNKNFTMPKDVSSWYCKNMCYFYESGICASSSQEQWKVLSSKYKEE